MVDEDNCIISGARRFLALEKLVKEGVDRYATIDVEVRSFEDDTELISFIIESNLSREKTWEQKVREGWAIHKSVKEEARYDQFKGLKGMKIVPKNFPQQKGEGETLNRVAKRVGLKNGRAYHNYSKILKSAKELEEDDQQTTSKQLKELANESVSAALFVIDYEKFDLLMDTGEASKKSVSNFRRSNEEPKNGETDSADEDVFDPAEWLKSFINEVKGVVSLSDSDPNSFNSIKEDLKKQWNGEFDIEQDEEKTSLTITLEL